MEKVKSLNHFNADRPWNQTKAFFDPLTPEEERFILKELGEDPDQVKKDIEQILEWLEQEQHLPDDVEPEIILPFLRSCKYSLENTKRKLEKLFMLRSKHPEFYSSRDPCDPSILKIRNIGYIANLPKLTPEGYRVSFLGIKDPDIDFDYLTMMKSALISLDVGMLIAGLTAGFVLILDARGFRMDHIFKAPFALIMKFLRYLQEGYPERVKQVHVIGASHLVAKIIPLIKPVVKSKILDRVYIHTEDYTELHKMVPKEILPSDLGGEGETLQQIHDRWVECVTGSMRDWVIGTEKQKASESYSNAKNRSKSDFGLDGSFRRLAVD